MKKASRPEPDPERMGRELAFMMIASGIAERAIPQGIRAVRLIWAQSAPGSQFHVHDFPTLKAADHVAWIIRCVRPDMLQTRIDLRQIKAPEQGLLPLQRYTPAPPADPWPRPPHRWRPANGDCPCELCAGQDVGPVLSASTHDGRQHGG